MPAISPEKKAVTKFWKDFFGLTAAEKAALAAPLEDRPLVPGTQPREGLRIVPSVPRQCGACGMAHAVIRCIHCDGEGRIYVGSGHKVKMNRRLCTICDGRGLGIRWESDDESDRHAAAYQALLFRVTA